ncbi:MAG: di-trans,poly-cis-decaprenylcistransferase [Haliscomenobacteraceae bacterium CHB4]|nr:di-trans,poly-cis-decaprenylcistransferase [Haliscomenobacteraceae bacterium CHB4]
MSDLKPLIIPDKVPRHIAIIMDGNGRWAKQKGMPRVLGHRSGVKSVREVTEAAAEIGVQYLTLYAFSTENWSRPPAEVTALMSLLVETIKGEIRDLNKNGVRLTAIGDIEALPKASYKALLDGIEKTKDNKRITLVLALNYSAKWEILRATRLLAEQAKNGLLQPADINEGMFENALSTRGIPDPELLIRTSGETRISNFLLWQIAYAELYFTPVFWPDFGRRELHEANWDIGILGYWDIGILGYWDIGILGYWDIGILGYFVVINSPSILYDYARIYCFGRPRNLSISHGNW